MCSSKVAQHAVSLSRVKKAAAAVSSEFGCRACNLLLWGPYAAMTRVGPAAAMPYRAYFSFLQRRSIRRASPSSLSRLISILPTLHSSSTTDLQCRQAWGLPVPLGSVVFLGDAWRTHAMDGPALLGGCLLGVGGDSPSVGRLQVGAGLLEVARKLEPSIGERFMIFVR